ncbi:MAG: hypothetical protein QM757_21485 [Paludibaculum sp.]
MLFGQPRPIDPPPCHLCGLPHLLVIRKRVVTAPAAAQVEP